MKPANGNRVPTAITKEVRVQHTRPCCEQLDDKFKKEPWFRAQGVGVGGGGLLGFLLEQVGDARVSTAITKEVRHARGHVGGVTPNFGPFFLPSWVTLGRGRVGASASSRDRDSEVRRTLLVRSFALS